ncbi:MAG: hypothetical protein J7K88_13135 [Candidatus Fermentibacteraceae bacterium]|nr:hypothetical protein [Candidatus Fermentibacteraceae bacterium]
MITKETSRLPVPGYAQCSKAAGKTKMTGMKFTLKNIGSCVDNPGYFISSK